MIDLTGEDGGVGQGSVSDVGWRSCIQRPMKVDQRAVRAIRVKVERAHEQLMALGNELRAFDEKKPYRMDAEVHAQGATHLRRIRLTEPIPLIWSVMLGEVIHNLRSALDQTVYWLTVDWTRTDPGMSTAFPIFTRRRTLRSERGFADVNAKHPDGIPGSGLYMLRGVGPGPRTFIERVQPYPQRNGPLPKALLALKEFWNQDKHRLVHLFGVVLQHEQVTVSGPLPASVVDLWVSRGVVDDGAVAVRVTCDPPAPQVEVHGVMRIVAAVRAPGRHRRSAEASLTDMCIDTAMVCFRLIDAIGHQEEAIGMGVFQPRSDGLFADLIERYGATAHPGT